MTTYGQKLEHAYVAGNSTTKLYIQVKWWRYRPNDKANPAVKVLFSQARHAWKTGTGEYELEAKIIYEELTLWVLSLPKSTTSGQ